MVKSSQTEWIGSRPKKLLLLSTSVFLRVAVPLSIAVLLIRYCVVYPGFAAEPLSRFIGQLSRRQPLFFLVGLTLLLSLVADRFWKRVASRWVFGSSANKGVAPSKRLGAWSSTIALVATAAGMAWLLRTYLFEAHCIVGASMLPTFEIGDEVLVSKTAYGWRHAFNLRSASPSSPKRGELVVFNFAETNGSEQLVLKRVIGVAGDRIRMQGNVPIINGWRVPFCDVGPYANLVGQQFVVGRLAVEFLGGTTYLTLHTLATREPFDGEYLVKSGEVFVLGDHRSESIDSRVWNEGRGGGVPLGSLVGRAERFLVSVRQSGDWDFSRAFRTIQPLLAVDGIETTTLTAAIENCYRHPPADLVPPSASSVAVAQRN